MFIDDFKKSILQKAIQGKLVEQNQSDEPANELLNRINEEKERLIKDGKIKKEKPLPPITDDEKSFIIPSNWVWVRFGNLSINHDSERRPVSKEDRISNEGTYNYYGATGAIDKIDDYIFDGEFLMIGEDGGNFYTYKDNSFIVSGKFWANNHVHVTEPVLVNIKYLKYYLDSLNLPALGLIHGIAIPKLNQTSLNGICVALPPLEEQKRIVVKLDELLLLLEEARPLEEEIINLEKEFPSKLRQAILQYAIQGKLTEQSSKDEPTSELLKKVKEEKEKLIKEGKIKKEKALEPIADEEKPFKIPSSWEWVRIGSVLKEVIVPQRDKPPFSEQGIPRCRIEDRDGIYLNGSKSNQFVSEKTIKEKNLKIYPVGTVLSACTGGSIGTIIINTVECCTNQTFNGLVCSSGLFNWYLFRFLTSKFNKLRNTGTGTTIPYISQDKTRQMIIPLPPLEEQKRIVTKLDELMNLCDILEESVK